MEQKIIAVGPGNVSRPLAPIHDSAERRRYRPVIDRERRSLPRSIGRERKPVARVSKFFSPALNGDPAFHVEVPQPHPQA